MSFDPTNFLSEYGVSATLEKMVSAAYQQGVNDGIGRILQAAQSAVEPFIESSGNSTEVAAATVKSDSRDEGIKRVARGLVQSVLSDMVASEPGLSISDYERLVLRVEPDISSKSIGNDLRRGEGTRYKRDRPGGNKWYPIDYRFEEAASNAEAAAPSMFSNQEGGDGHGPATT